MEMADEEIKKIRNIAIITGAGIGVFFLFRHFFNSYVETRTENQAIDTKDNAATYATQLYIALAKGKWFTGADKDQVFNIITQIPNMQMFKQVQDRYWIKTDRGTTLNQDLQKIFSNDEYNGMLRIIRQNEQSYQRNKKNLKAIKAPVFNATDVAKSLYQAAGDKNMDKVLSVLGQITNTTQYWEANYAYKKIPTLVSRTIVTDLLNYAFKYNEQAKTRIKKEFIRIGLKVNPTTGTWSLEGIRMDI